MRSGRLAGVRRRLIAVVAVLAMVPAAPSYPQTTTTYRYDAVGRLVEVQDSNVESDIAARPIGYGYDAAGNRTRAGGGAAEEYAVVEFHASSTDQGTTGRTPARGLRDIRANSLDTVHLSDGAADAWIYADLGVARSVGAIDVAAARLPALGLSEANLNGSKISWSQDAVSWTDVENVTGVASTGYRSIAVTPMIARYWRILRPAGHLALGEFRLFSKAPPSGGVGAPEEEGPPGNHAPVANADALTVALNTAGSLNPITNDTDADGDVLHLVSVGPPPSGQAVANLATGVVTYTPLPGFVGAETFSYRVADIHNVQATGYITVTVSAAANRAPTARPDAITSNNSAVVLFNPLLNDDDPDGEAITLVTANQPSHGEVLFYAPNQAVVYVPAAHYSGPDSFTYVIQDARGATATGQVSVTVTAGPNRSPVANADFATAQSGEPTTYYPMINDSDPDGDPIHVFRASVATPNLGTVTHNPATGAVTYTPAAGFTGEARIYYGISDPAGAAGSNAILFTVVPAGNHAPVAVNDTRGVRRDTPLSFSPQVNDTDQDGDVLMVTSASTPAHGTVAIATPGASLTYTPAAGYTGPDSFTYTVSDGQGGGASGTVALSVTDPASANAPPAPVNDAFSMATDTRLTFDPRLNDVEPDGDGMVITAIGAPSHGAAVITNSAGAISYRPAAGYAGPDSFSYTISDGHGGSATATINMTVYAPRGFSLSPAVDGKTHWNLDVDGSLSLPDAGLWRIIPDRTFQVMTKAWAAAGGPVNPGGATGVGGAGGYASGAVTLQQGVEYILWVGSGGRAPYGGSPIGGTAWGNIYAGGGGGFSGVTIGTQGWLMEGQILIAGGGGGAGWGADGGAGGGSGGQAGASYQAAAGGAGGTQTSGSTEYLPAMGGVAIGGHFAGAGGAGYHGGLAGGHVALVGGGGGGGGSGFLRPTSVTAGVLMGGNRTIPGNSNDPDRGAAGLPALTPGAQSGPGKVILVGIRTLPLADANGAPTAGGDSRSIRTGDTLTLDPRTNDSDPDLDALAVTAVGTPSHGVATLGSGGGSVSYVSTLGYTGPDSFSYTISDGRGGTATGTVSVTVVANVAPTAANDNGVAAQGSLTLDPRTNDSDPEGDPLTITAVSTPAHGTASIAVGGVSVTYTATADYWGPDSFTYTISDGRGATATATVNLTVPVTPVTWNPADKNAAITLSNDNLTMTSAGNSDRSVRATKSRAAGKWYFETTQTVVYASSNVTGIATAAASLADGAYVGSSGASYGYSSGGNILTGGSVVATSSTYAEGAVIGVAVDLGANRIWWSKDGVWNGNPANGTGGLTITPGTYFPASGGALGSVIAANFGASAFTGAVPRGFAPWDASVGAAANHAPTAANDSVSVDRNIAKVIDPRLNDTDGDADPLTITAVSTPSHGTVTIASGGASVTYTPASGYLGADSFTYTVSDGAGGTATATVNLTVVVIPVTWNPADKYAPFVLSNGNLTASLTGQAPGLRSVRGTAARSTDKWYYETTLNQRALGNTFFGVAGASLPLTEFAGKDATSHGLYAMDGKAYTASAVVSGGPVFGAIPAGSVIGIAADLTNNRIWYRVGSGPWNGSASASPGANIGGLPLVAGTYYPAFSAEGYSGGVDRGTANFGGSAFTGAVPRGFAPWDDSTPPAANHVPAAANDSVAVERSLAKTFDPRLNDTDGDADPLTITAVSTPSHGTVTIASGGASVTYTPASGYLGADSFTYTVSDGAGGTATATVNLTVAVTPVTWNPADKNASVTLSNGDLTMTSAGSSDRSVRATTSQSAGKYYFETTQTVVYASSNVTGIATAAASLANGAYVGSSGASYGYTSGGNILTGGGVVATSSPYAGGAVIGVAVDLGANRIWWSKNGVWNGNPANGTGGLSIAAGTYFPAASGALGSIIAANFGGSPFTGVLPRGFAPWDASITAAANHSPTAANDSVSVDRNVAKVIDPRLNDTDGDADPLIITAVSAPAHGTVTIANGGASVTYTPASDYLGADSFTYTVSDGAGGTATASVNLTVVVIPVTWNPADKASSLALSGGNLTVANNGDFAPNQAVRATMSRSSGKWYFENSITSDGRQNTGLAAAAFTGVASPGVYTYLGGASPSIGYTGESGWIHFNDAQQTTQTPLATGDVLQIAVDLDTKRFWAKRTADAHWNGSASSSPAAGTGGVSFSNISAPLFPALTTRFPGSVSAANFGASAFTGAVPRGFAPWDASVGAAANHAPTAANDSVSVDRNIAKVIDPRLNDTDGDADPLTITAVSTPSHGTVTIASGGASVTYTPASGYLGADSFTYTVSDGAGGTATATVNLTVVVIPVTWNPADKYAPFVLSNGNLTASLTGQAPGLRSVRGTAARSTDKWYYETTLNQRALGNTFFGVAGASLPLTEFAGKDATSHGLYAMDGKAYTASAVVSGGPVFGAIPAGSVIGIAADLTNNRIWYRVGSGPWNGSASASPGANIGGLPLVAGTYYPAFSAEGYSGGVDRGTANFGGSAFTGAVPRGFAPWDDSTPPAANHVPAAANDSVAVERSLAKTFDPRLNDTDGDADPLTITAVSTPSHGTVTIASGGASVTYTPASGYLGADSFTYTVSDGAGGTATATVNLTVAVTPVTWNPADKASSLALSGGNLTVTNNGAFGPNPGVRATVSRSSGKWYFENSITSGGPQNTGLATAAFTGIGAADAYSYLGGASPSIGFSGEVGWIHFNDAQQTTQTPLATGDVVQIAVDLDARRFWAKRTADAYWNGSASASPASGTGGVSYSNISAPLFPALTTRTTGTVSTANFGASAFAGPLPRGFAPWDASADATLNHAPTAANDSVSVERSLAKTFDPRLNDTDGDADPLTITAVSTPSHGTVTIASGGASVTYTPASGYLGADSFTYTVSDGAGGTATATVNLTVAVTPVTWNPADKNASVTLSNGDLTMTSAGSSDRSVRATTSQSAGKYYFETTQTVVYASSNVTGIATAAASLANGAYVGSSGASYGYTSGGNILTGGGVVATSSPYAGGAVIGVAVDLGANRIWWSKNGVWNGNPANGTGGLSIAAGTYFPAASGALGSIIAANFGGSPFTGVLPRGFAPWDASAGPAANRVPVAVNDSLGVKVNTAKVVDPRVNDGDPDGDALTITAVSTPGHGAVTIASGGASVTYTPASDYLGADSFTYTVSDGAGGTATASVTLSVSAARAFTISPAVNGKSTWDLEVDGPLVLSSTGTWSLTPSTAFVSTTKLWGAGGGGGNPSRSEPAHGGGGGFVSGSLDLAPTDSVTVIVGGGGDGNGVGGAGGGGAAISQGAYGGGGGRSAIAISGSPQLVAGGGGGGGYDFAGGPGGGAVGGRNVGDGGGGYGGTQSAGGSGGGTSSVGGAGTAGQGGNSTYFGGGGGGGYYGGGGSGTTSGYGNGGGGGSSYYGGSRVTGGATSAGNGRTPGGVTETGYSGLVGQGGAGSAGGAGTAGAAGAVIFN